MSKRLLGSLAPAIILAIITAATAYAQWPTSCVELNDIVEAHLGNHHNVGIYQATFGDQAEQACQNDHHNDVRSVFAWAIGGENPSPPAVAALAVNIVEIPADLPNYDRNQWGNWIDADGDCQNTRHEVLIVESQVSVTYKTAENCRVVSGQWYGVYTGTTVTQPSQLDIDHMVPLANAHKSGAWEWPEERKRAYFNSLEDADHLIAVTNSANRSKGARGPEQWKPGNAGHWCDYAQDWIRIKNAWGLTVTAAEADALREMLGRCDEPLSLSS